ncbi:MAG: hypothetical protein WCK73_03625 [Deltaproteobacteria bacterium]
MSHFRILAAAAAAFMLTATGCAGSSSSPGLVSYSIDANAGGLLETVDGIANLTVVSRDPNDLRAEYRAGFVQGKMQASSVVSARDNSWDNIYQTDPGHNFPRQPGPSAAELDRAAGILRVNYGALLSWIRSGKDAAPELRRVLFRMLGIYHGATRAAPAALDFGGVWLPDEAYLTPAELALGYETQGLSFLDVYFLNTFADLMDVITFSARTSAEDARPTKCSAFLKRVGDEVFLTHNTWQGFLSQTMAMTLWVNDVFLTVNASTPGLVNSGTDFGWNRAGIMFNETTHRVAYTEPREAGLWTLWRAAVAEAFSTSIDDFFRYISIDSSGTYQNGYMVVDAKTRETGLVEMSYRCFIFYRSSGGAYAVTAKPVGGASCSTDYDHELVSPVQLLGINFPASLQVRADLQSTDNRPARRVQFLRLLPSVADVEGAKTVITYTDPANPLSIYGRWDLGYGETAYPKMVPDGSLDAKVATASMAREALTLTGTLDPASTQKGMWMRFGTARVNGAPFTWSRSSWSWQKLRDVPDTLDGSFQLLGLHLR